MSSQRPRTRNGTEKSENAHTVASTIEHKQSHFEGECRDAIDGVRAALLDLYASVGADPEEPQEVSRRFGVNKTLAWNVSKVMTLGNPLDTIPNLPGAAAFQTLLTAIERGGADAKAIARANRALKSLDETVTRHAGDRATLELIMDGISPDSENHLDHSRKLAFRGNSGLLGVQAKVRLMTVFMAPNEKDSARLDIAMVRGFLGLRRLRSAVRWPIFQLRGWGSEPALADDREWKPLDPRDQNDLGLALMSRFSNVGPDDIEVTRTASGANHVLTPGPIGNAGAIDCFLGDFARAVAPRYRNDADTTGEFGATISAPTERLVFDIIAHESLDFALRLEARAFAGIFMDPSEESVPEGRLPIPVPQAITRMPGQPPVVATAAFSRYRELTEFVYERLRWSPDEFRGCRFDLSYPPLGSTVLLRFQLPEAPR